MRNIISGIAPDALRSYPIFRLVLMKYLQCQIKSYGIKSCQKLGNMARIECSSWCLPRWGACILVRAQKYRNSFTTAMTNTDEDDDDDTNAKTEHQLLSPLGPLFERFSAGFSRALLFLYRISIIRRISLIHQPCPPPSENRTQNQGEGGEGICGR